MEVCIMFNHPIATSAAPQCWDGKTHEYPGDPLDVAALGKWLTGIVGIRFNYKPGHSRVENGRCIFFPARYTSGLHCMWIEPVATKGV